MPGLFGMLNLGSRALGVQSAAMEVTGNNIANAATAGYHRQTLNITPSEIVGGFGQGSFAGGIRRAYNQFTENQLLLQTATTAQHERRSTALNVVDAMFNESTTAGLSGAFDEFYAAMADMGTFPDSGAVRNTVLGAAQTLVRRFNDLSQGLETMAADLDDQIKVDVARVNEITANIASLNGQIAYATGRGETPGNLLDQRAELLSELNTYVNTRVSEAPDGQVSVTVGGITLVQDGESHALSTAKDPDNDDHLSVMIRDSSGGYRDLSRAIDAGKIGAAVELRDQTLDAYGSELDTLAWDFATRMNEVHSAGFGLDGATGRDLFDVSATVSGAAASLSVSAHVAGQPDRLAASSTAAGVPGDGTNALSLYGTSTELRTSLGEMTFSQYFANLAGEVGSDARYAAQQFEHEDSQLYEISTLNQTQSGVNLDEEAAELQKFQAAYQASARFVSAIDEMLDVLMRM